MKKVTKSVRLTTNEAALLYASAKKARLTESDYIRSLINHREVQVVDHAPEIMDHVCKLYVLLHEAGLDDNSTLMQEVNALCQTL